MKMPKSMSMGMGGKDDKGGKEVESDAPSGVPTEQTVSDAPSHVPTPMKMGMGMGSGGMGMGMTDKGDKEGKGTSENEFLVTSKRCDSNRFATIWALKCDIQIRIKAGMERPRIKNRRVKARRARKREAKSPKTKNQRKREAKSPKTKNQRTPRAPRHQREWYDDSSWRNRSI
jgi:hypothetical protein